MKKILVFLITLFITAVPAFSAEIVSVKDLKQQGIISNSPISKDDLEKAKSILIDVHKKTALKTQEGHGPFYAVILDSNGNIIAEKANSVVNDKCSLYHAEVNTIKAAHEKLKTYDLAPYNLSIYVNAEPCIMCAGAIMWSGIKTVYFSVPSKDVEKITGFDEGYKPNWVNEFKKRNIKVYGNIESDIGKKVLSDYVQSAGKIYKPSR